MARLEQMLKGLRYAALGVLACVVVGSHLAAQDKKAAPAKDAWAVVPSGTNVLTLAGSEPPALSDVEKLKVENLNLLDELRKAILEADTCRGQIAQPRAAATEQQITAGVQALKAGIEKAHPGYTWDAGTGTFTANPAPAPEAKKP